jgi:hypothetical protein
MESVRTAAGATIRNNIKSLNKGKFEALAKLQEIPSPLAGEG